MTRPSMLLALAVLAAGACRSTTPEVSSRIALRMQPVPDSTAALDSVSVAVPLPPEPWAGGRCDEIGPIPTARDLKLVSMVWGSGMTQERRVTVGFDGLGRPVGYTDVRGGLTVLVPGRSPDDPVEPGTLIIISLPERRASIENRYADGRTERVALDYGQALESDRLGDPARIMEGVFDRCAGGR